MSNYNLTLQSNNTNLQEILNTINSLPDTGDGEQATPVISVNSSTGLITATAGTKSATKQLTTQAAKTITPSTTEQTVVSSGVYTTGAVKVAAMSTTTRATPTISVNANGIITASVTQTAGYVSAGTQYATKQLAFQAAKTITPSTTSQIAVSSGYYTGGNITVAAVPTQTKSATPTSSTQDITPDSGKFLSKVTVAGDSNLVAGNIKSGISIFGVAGNYVGSGSGDSGEVDYTNEDALITRTISTYSNDRVETIGSYVFYSYISLITVNFPACTNIGNNAFQACYYLTSVNFPACTNIGSNAFYDCSGLTSVNFPACTNIGSNAFAYCSVLTSVSFPACTNISNNAFSRCYRLTSVNFPVCTSIGNYAFYYCSRLTSVNFPVCTSIGNYAFIYCSRLTSVNFPACTNIGSNAFSDCSSLTTISFGDNITSATIAATIYSSAFLKCFNLTTLKLYYPFVATLSNSNAFSSTPIAGYTISTNGVYGSIYVPASLVAAYKSAANWSYFANRIVSMPATQNGGGFDD